MLDNNYRYSSVQSAYKKCQSTETALLKIQSDILIALDSGPARDCVVNVGLVGGI